MTGSVRGAAVVGIGRTSFVRSSGRSTLAMAAEAARVALADEAVLQLRGDAGQRQVAGAETALVTSEQSGLRLPARIVGVDPAEVTCGLRVRAEITELPGGGYRVPVFRPVAAAR